VTLVDTSAWIAFFRGEEPCASVVEGLLEENQVVLCGPILTELRRGLRPQERRQVLPLLEGCGLLEQPTNLWLEAGDLGAVLARKGASPKSLDLLIATYALAHDVPLLTLDRDFELMRRAGASLHLVPVPRSQ
jgi:predicted nucleic acid-binding protein